MGIGILQRLNKKNDKTIISGKIVHNPDEEGKERSKTWGNVVGFIIFSPLILMLNLIEIVVTLFSKIIKTQEKHLSTSDKLDKFMLNYLNCKKI